MPTDPYPTPLAPEPKKKRKRKGRRSSHRPEFVSRQAAVDAGRALATRAVTEVSEASAQVAARTTDAGRSLWQRIASATWSLVRFWTPFRIVILCIVLAVGATVYLTTRDSSDDAAIARLRQSNDDARQALEDGDIKTAREHFDVAVTALDQLDHSDSLAREIRQLHRETTAMQDLLSSSVFDIAAEAEEAYAQGKQERFETDFRLHHFNRWIVLEGPVIRSGHTPQGAVYRIDVPSAIGDQGRTLTISGRFPALDTLKFRDSRREVIFAGQLKSCALSRDRRAWVLRLEPQSAFLWTNQANYAALGLASADPERSEAVSRILATQSLASGLER